MSAQTWPQGFQRTVLHQRAPWTLPLSLSQRQIETSWAPQGSSGGGWEGRNLCWSPEGQRAQWVALSSLLSSLPTLLPGPPEEAQQRRILAPGACPIIPSFSEGPLALTLQT